MGHHADERVGNVTFGDFEEAFRSVINFGIRQLYGRLAPDIDEIEKQLFDALVGIRTADQPQNSPGSMSR